MSARVARGVILPRLAVCSNAVLKHVRAHQDTLLPMFTFPCCIAAVFLTAGSATALTSVALPKSKK